MAELEALQRFIKTVHGCDSEHLDSFPIHVTLEDKIVVWQGSVEVFTLLGHSKARRCFAWIHGEGEKDEQLRYRAVLEAYPMDTPLKVVRAAFAGTRPKGAADPIH